MGTVLFRSSEMEVLQKKLVLWTGRKHSGKTTRAEELALRARREGFEVAGLLAKAQYQGGRLVAFDGVDLQSGAGAPLAKRSSKVGGKCGFSFIAEGLQLGKSALSPESVGSAELVIIDEFGPLEMNSEGWRSDVDLLVRSGNALIVVVVRDELSEEVGRLYADSLRAVVCAGERGSVDEVISMLKDRREARRTVR